ncbi:hypothetical protein N7468_001444 [Penicillium chermesinum]|uniref:Uncharacterized protein n=1 Tax=Penicillium chermesinum TaxID=63820 RepID=A0A9W9PIC6_9EURO|nr:uncharacterized protein N7468_001444 [Penicillium chermesinum]KAJ5246461.1 hypothetical protein N7468_001444 [Penicillium chermesinum]
MPAILTPETLLEPALVRRTAPTAAPNATTAALEVVCAWPVSGQYGPGTRYLYHPPFRVLSKIASPDPGRYYVLIAACVFARKAEFIRNACLAAVLLFPAVAALHGIVLASLHVDGAVDMDVYGAFQLCAIGILTAPATVRLSATYFHNPGREIIFLWTGLLLAGLLSLTVEFIRLSQPLALQTTRPLFPGRKQGNFSTEVHAAWFLDFNTATLLAAACCVPAILSLVSMWIKILDDRWDQISGTKRLKKENEPIEGTNGATPIQMSGIATKIREWLRLIEIPVFAAGVLAILVKGEMNFWSAPVNYQTEPMSSVGQWAPVVGTGLAIVGSLYLLFAAEMDKEDKPSKNPVPPCPTCGGDEMYRDRLGSTSSGPSSRDSDQEATVEMEETVSYPSFPKLSQITTLPGEDDPGGRRTVARFFNAASGYLATKAHTNFEENGFEVNERTTFPEVPAESFRNEHYQDMKNIFESTPITRSRATSFVGSEYSNGEGSSRTPRETPNRQLSLPVRSPKPAFIRRPHSKTLPSRSNSFEVPSFVDRGAFTSSPTSDRSSPEPQHGTSDPSIAESLPATPRVGPPTTPTIVVSDPLD